jgi:hypothetical protein
VKRGERIKMFVENGERVKLLRWKGGRGLNFLG